MITVKITGGGTIAFGNKNLRKVLLQAAQEVAGEARGLIRAKIGGGRTYRGSGGSRAYRGYKPGHYSASRPGAAPSSVTGTLARSIKVRPWKDGSGVSIRDTMFYAKFLEAGAQGGVASGKRGEKGKKNPTRHGKRVGVVGKRIVAARPFLTTALAHRQASIYARLRAAIDHDIAWKKAP